MDTSQQRPCRALIELCSVGAVPRCLPLTMACTGLINEDCSFLRCSVALDYQVAEPQPQGIWKQCCNSSRLQKSTKPRILVRGAFRLCNYIPPWRSCLEFFFSLRPHLLHWVVCASLNGKPKNELHFTGKPPPSHCYRCARGCLPGEWVLPQSQWGRAGSLQIPAAASSGSRICTWEIRGACVRLIRWIFQPLFSNMFISSFLSRCLCCSPLCSLPASLCVSYRSGLDVPPSPFS